MQVARSRRIIEHMDNDFDSDLSEMREIAAFSGMSEPEREDFDQRLTAIASTPSRLRLGKNEVDRKKFIGVVNHAFDLIGGVPRLALWADSNPDKFYSLWAKANNGPQNKDMHEKIEIELTIKRNSNLDDVGVTSKGVVYDHKPSQPDVEDVEVLPE